MKTYLAALSMLVLAACDLGPVASNWIFRGQIQPLSITPEQAPPLELEVIGSGMVAITGAATTPCWNDNITLDGKRSGTTLIMTIERAPQQPCSDQRTRHHLYAGIFSQLRPGDYTFRVVNATGAAPVVELETTVNVR